MNKEVKYKHSKLTIIGGIGFVGIIIILSIGNLLLDWHDISYAVLVCCILLLFGFCIMVGLLNEM